MFIDIIYLANSKDTPHLQGSTLNNLVIKLWILQRKQWLWILDKTDLELLDRSHKNNDSI